MANAAQGASRAPFLVPSAVKQCWGFMIGSALFAVGSAPGFAAWAGTPTANLCYFVGAWFFTAAGFVQLLLSGGVARPALGSDGTVVRAEWLAAVTQSFGTVLFNISTTAALTATSVAAQQHRVWSPDAGGSVAFLISGVFTLVAYARRSGWWDPRRVDWWSAQINMAGCVAFAVSAVAAFVLATGNVVNGAVANGGTFIGALCFLLASLIVLPSAYRHAARRQRSA